MASDAEPKRALMQSYSTPWQADASSPLWGMLHKVSHQGGQLTQQRGRGQVPAAQLAAARGQPCSGYRPRRSLRIGSRRQGCRLRAWLAAIRRPKRR